MKKIYSLSVLLLFVAALGAGMSADGGVIAFPADPLHDNFGVWRAYNHYDQQGLTAIQGFDPDPVTAILNSSVLSTAAIPQQPAGVLGSLPLLPSLSVGSPDQADLPPPDLGTAPDQDELQPLSLTSGEDTASLPTDYNLGDAPGISAVPEKKTVLMAGMLLLPVGLRTLQILRGRRNVAKPSGLRIQ